MSIEENISQIKGFENVKEIYEGNKKNINVAFAVFVVVLGAVYYYFKFYKPGQEEKAHTELFTAERYFRNDSLDKALYGDGQYMGMIDVADAYSSTDAGKLANFYAGRIFLEKGEFDQALEHLKKASFDDHFLASGRLMLIGDCQSELGDFAAAAESYFDAATKKENELIAPQALMKAGLAYEAAGDYKGAIKSMQLLEEDYAQSMEAEQAEKYIAKYKARLNAE